MSVPYRLAIVGYGIMGERLLRAALDHASDFVTVTGLWDPSADAMARLARDLPHVPRAASADALLGNADVLYIASPPASHLGYAQAALDAGLSVFCEKPFAVDVAEAESFLARNGAKAKRIAVNFPFASSLGVEQLRAWLNEGDLGVVQKLDIEVGFAHWPRPWQMDAVNWLDRRAQGGFVREVVSHFLFLASRLGGPLLLHPGHSIAYPEADRSERGVAAALTAGALPLSLHGKVGETPKPDHNLFTVTAAHGSIRIRDWAEAERLDAAGNWQPAPGAMPNEKARPLVLRRQLEKLGRLARNETESDFPLATADEAFAVQRIVETLLKG
ncbi:Gfo/Idh/MocA family oxidoreductase [Ferrovibrio sp. MS7]|uniref:Gfo/Idh/MocA family protein n=1 Tax=Ferrovibrio plantarum TaxID=3119164 RepID=UPI003135B26B